jgi:hypothetical protein
VVHSEGKDEERAVIILRFQDGRPLLVSVKNYIIFALMARFDLY